MPASASLESVPDGTDIFIDANIFVYGLTGVSSQCARLLEKCARQLVTGVCLFEVINEATHHFMLAEALRRGFIRKGGDWKSLGRQPDLLRKLHEYWTDTERVLSLNLLLVGTDEMIIRRAHVVRQTAGLLTNDSIIVSFLHSYGIGNLATADAAFERVGDIAVFRPNDLP